MPRLVAILALTCVILTGCGSGTPDTRPFPSAEEPAVEGVDLATWAGDNLGYVTEGSDLMQDIAYAADDMDVAALEDACDELGGWARRGQQLDPAPDPDVNDPWQAALDDALMAAEACVNGASTGDSDELSRSADYISRFSDHILAATSALEGTR